MFKITIETEDGNCTVELPITEEVVLLDEALVAVEQALYGVGYRFKGELQFVKE